MRNLFFRNVLYVLIAAAFVVACSKKEAAHKAPPRPVRSMIIGEAQSMVWRNFPGKVTANKEAKLAFEVTGTLVEFPVKEGDIVKKGQLLARMAPKKYKDRVNEMYAKYIRQRSDYLRAKELVKKDYVSRAEYDSKKAAYLVAEANYNTAKHDLRDTVLRAPFDGVVARKLVENHEYVIAKQVILELNNTDYVDIEIDVPESVMVHLRKDRDEADTSKIYATFDSLPGKKFKVDFKEFSSSADPETQTYRVTFTMPIPKDINILPGMTATIHAALPDFMSGGGDYFTVPSSAVYMSSDGKASVWVIDDATMKVSKAPVTVSRLSNTEVRILTGVKKGQRIVTAGVHYLREGEVVKLMPKNPAKTEAQ